MKKSKTGRMLVCLATAGMVISPAMARDAAQMRDIIGDDSDDATRTIKDRGFTYIEGNHDKYQNKHTYWWNDRSDNCIHVISYRGEIRNVADAKDKDCNQGGGGGNTAAAVIGVAAGAALLGALLHKKHHKKDKEYNDEQTIEFERGFRDGLHNAAYHNYNRDDAYADGYTAGHEQREANLAHHKGYGGYIQTVQYKDLDGARAAGADTQLQRRGFRNVDGFKSGTAAYTIWYRGQSSQCLQMMVVNGRVEDIRDIQSHPKCR